VNNPITSGSPIRDQRRPMYFATPYFSNIMALKKPEITKNRGIRKQ